VATLGITSPGTGSFPLSDGRTSMNKYTMPEAGTVTGATAFFDYDAVEPTSAGCTTKFLIYAADGTAGAPGTLIAVSDAQAVDAGDQTVNYTISASLNAFSSGSIQRPVRLPRGVGLRVRPTPRLRTLR
jgi:hypothetical protein